MILGHVNADNEAIVSLPVLSRSGETNDVLAIIDTGFDGYLTLPADLIAALGLQWKHRGRAELADGSTIDFNVYRAAVTWDGRDVDVLVDSADVEPLLGMRLLDGQKLTIEVTSGGVVEIQRLK